MTALIYSPSYLTYRFGPDHPFSPVRLEMAIDLLAELGHAVAPIEPGPASRDELLSVHKEEYVRLVETASGGEAGTGAERAGLGTPDTPIFPGMDLAARHLVGGTLHGARMLLEGQCERVLQFGGGMHHALPDGASGFCVYNDLAVAIRFLVEHGWTVAYVDIDVHHGDGVQAVFEDEPRVLYVSLHESGQYLFPGTGEVHELGRGPARGTKLNLPLAPFTEDESYLRAFNAVVPQALASFHPDVLMVQAGADAHFADPLADLLLTTHAYEALFRRLLDLAQRHTKGRILFTLGGGYDVASAPRVWTLLYLVMAGLPIPEELPGSWRERWQAQLGKALPATLHDPDPAYPSIAQREEISNYNRRVTDRLLDLVAPIWY